MKIQTEELGNCLVQLTVEVEPALIEQAKRQVAKKYARQVNVRGFRRGKAPYSMVIHSLGEQKVLEEALPIIAQNALEDGVKESGLTVYSLDDLEADVVTPDPLTYSFIFSTPSQVKLGDLKWIKVEENQITVSEQEVDQALEELRQSRVVWQFSDGLAEYGDIAVYDLRMELMGETVANETENKVQLRPKDNLEVMVTDNKNIELEQYLIGMTPGQEERYPILYPMDWGNKKFAGRTVDYHIKLRSLERKILPELNDEFAQSVGKFESMPVLREHIYNNLSTQAKNKEFNRVTREILDGLVDESEVEFPQLMLKQEIQFRLQERKRQLESQKVEYADWLESIGKTEEEVEDDLRDEAEEDLRRSLVLTEYVHANQIEVKPEEVELELNLISLSYRNQAEVRRKQLRQQPGFMDQLARQVLGRKGNLHLYAAVIGKDSPPLYPELAELLVANESSQQELEQNDYDDEEETILEAVVL